MKIKIFGKRLSLIALFLSLCITSNLSAQNNVSEASESLESNESINGYYYIIKAEISEISAKKKAKKNTFVLEKDEINKIQIKSNGIFRGPLKTVESMIATWIYEGLEAYTAYAVLQNDTVISISPKDDFPQLYEDIRYAFVQDRNAVISQYDVVPSSIVESKYQNETNVVLKKKHPRDYYFDLYSAGSKIQLAYNYEQDTFETGRANDLNFTNLVSNDTPKAGDKLHFHFNLRTPVSVKNLVFTIHNSDYRIRDVLTVAEKIDADGSLRDYVVFSLKDDFTNGLFLNIAFDNEGERPDYEHDKVALKLQPVIESTDTAKEAEILKNGVKKGLKIVEVITVPEFSDTEFSDKEEIENKEIQQEPAEEVVLEQLVISTDELEEERKKLEQRLRDIDEQKRQQEELAKALEAAKNSNKVRQEKEFLHDYEPEGAYDALKNQKPLKTYEDFQEFIEDPNEVDAEGKTLLIKAARMGNDWQIKALIASGADVNKQDKNGWTALMYSVRYQENLTAVNLLLDSGADPAILNNFGVSALTLATCYNNNPAILEKLLARFEPSNKDVLKSFTMLFINNQDTEFIQMAKLNCFLRKAVPLNTFYEGKTPLMYACQFGNSSAAIKLLLDNNANVTVRSSEGKSAFDYASKNTRLPHDDVYWSLNRKR